MATSPRTRLDRLVDVRERSEDAALEALGRARSGVGRAAEKLATLKEASRSDGRARGAVELWALEETAHVRTLQAVRTAERELAQAVRGEQAARQGYGAAHRDAEAVRRAQEKKRVEIVGERAKREQRDLDELATLRFNAGRR